MKVYNQYCNICIWFLLSLKYFHKNHSTILSFFFTSCYRITYTIICYYFKIFFSELIFFFFTHKLRNYQFLYTQFRSECRLISTKINKKNEVTKFDCYEKTLTFLNKQIKSDISIRTIRNATDIKDKLQRSVLFLLNNRKIIYDVKCNLKCVL